MLNAFNKLETTLVVVMLIRLYTQKFKLETAAVNTHCVLKVIALKWMYSLSSDGEDWEQVQMIQ